MSEAIVWLEDGTPHSPRFNDHYRHASGGLAHAKQVFLAGCELPQAWANQPHWCVLENGFGLGLNFLVTWQTWRNDPAKSKILHYVATEAFPPSGQDLRKSAAAFPELIPFAEELSAQWKGLSPGFHRLAFDAGQVLLTLCIGDAKAMLREQLFTADAIFLDGFDSRKNPEMWDLYTIKALAQCCRRGTKIATWNVASQVCETLTHCGFVVRKTAELAPKRHRLEGEFNPSWELRRSQRPPHLLALNPAPATPGSCIVIGAGLAGAACANSLARRGWSVQVLDSASEPATGASGLPAGIIAPNLSQDDNLLSRLSRAGVRATWQQIQTQLNSGAGIDWQICGVLERNFQAETAIDESKENAAAQFEWSRPATQQEKFEAKIDNLEHDERQVLSNNHSVDAYWHNLAGWVKPIALVKALISHPNIQFLAHSKVSQLSQQNSDNGTLQWQAINAENQLLAQADMLVIAAGFGSQALLPKSNNVPLQALRGQISLGTRNPVHDAAFFPHVPINGHGGFIPAVTQDNQTLWVLGSTFERNATDIEPQEEDHLANLAKLDQLVPTTAQHLAPFFANGNGVQAWCGIRCTTPDKLPSVGPVYLPGQPKSQTPPIWVCTGMGARGLTLAVLCGEILAARLHGEPLPVEKRLAQALNNARFIQSETKQSAKKISI